MNFVSWRDFHADIAEWERRLPQFDAVCGIPRSGLVPATYIALRRNIRLVPFDDLIRDPAGAISRASLRDTNPATVKKPAGNRLLLVDDSVSNAGVTLTAARQQLSGDSTLRISYGAVYSAGDKIPLDHVYRCVPMPRIFAWNWFRNWRIRGVLCDLDGVICEDWKHRSERNEDAEFVQHMETVKPLYVPEIPIAAIVTSRIERYRQQTVKWLEKHKIEYGSLVMHPAATPEERRRRNDHAAQKAAVYAASNSPLFVESDARQAAQIFEITGRPVLCIDTMQMHCK